MLYIVSSNGRGKVGALSRQLDGNARGFRQLPVSGSRTPPIVHRLGVVCCFCDDLDVAGGIGARVSDATHYKLSAPVPPVRPMWLPYRPPLLKGEQKRNVAPCGVVLVLQVAPVWIVILSDFAPYASAYSGDTGRLLRDR